MNARFGADSGHSAYGQPCHSLRSRKTSSNGSHRHHKTIAQSIGQSRTLTNVSFIARLGLAPAVGEGSMKLRKIAIRNFRRLENVTIDVEERETVFVGPNNSGKTSATAIFRAFLGSREFKIHDFSVATIPAFTDFGVAVDEPAGAVDAEPMADAGVQDPDPTTSDAPEAATDPEATVEAPTPAPEASPTLPEISLDLWFTIDPESIAFGRVYTLLQNLSD